jgi:hypothetical protein
MCVAMVHNGPQLFRENFRDVEKRLLELRSNGNANLLAVLKLITTDYEKAICGWGPWKTSLGYATSKLLNLDANDAARHVAYVNVAKCWTKGQNSTRDKRLTTLCDKATPLAQLTAILDPRVILAWGTSYPPKLNWGISPERLFQLYCFGTTAHPIGTLVSGEPIASWLPRAKKLL